jgi:uncharacterized protein YegP (UPF0339 family)
MIHLFKHKDGKYDIALVVKGRFIVGSNQHYSSKRGAFNAIISICENLNDGFGVGSATFQDDTFDEPCVCQIDTDGRVFKYPIKYTSKKYIPSTRKKK